MGKVSLVQHKQSIDDINVAFPTESHCCYTTYTYGVYFEDNKGTTPTPA